MQGREREDEVVMVGAPEEANILIENECVVCIPFTIALHLI
jgi:hypothetical protein